jgi:hypothetical protein
MPRGLSLMMSRVSENNKIDVINQAIATQRRGGDPLEGLHDINEEESDYDKN